VVIHKKMSLRWENRHVGIDQWVRDKPASTTVDSTVAADAGDELAGRVPSPGELIHEDRFSGAAKHTCSIASKRRIWRGEGGLLLPQCGDGNNAFLYYSFLVIQ
jgi:hypothetical protein